MKQAVQATTLVRGERAKTLGKIAIARIVSRALERSDQPRKVIARDLNTDEPNLSRWGSEHEPHGPHLKHLLAAAGTASHGVAVDLHRDLGDELGVQTLPRVDVVHDDHLARLAAVTAECTDVPRAYAAAIADGELSDADLEAIRAEGQQAIAAVLELDAFAAREQLRRRRGEP